MNSGFEVVVGVDQTGAKGIRGEAKPLPVSILIKSEHEWILKTPLFLSALNKKNLKNLFLEEGLSCEWNEVLVVADCVLGLPQKILMSREPIEYIHSLMRRAAKTKGVGLKAGECFFNDILNEHIDLLDADLLRKQESELKCLSVFKNRPFQRNVQTGTYRIWSDLGEEKNYLSFNIWPYENSPQKAYLCEGYPAYAKSVVKRHKGLKVKNTSLYGEVSRDHKDAAALALLGALFFKASSEIKDFKEGRILMSSGSMESV